VKLYDLNQDKVGGILESAVNVDIESTYLLTPLTVPRDYPLFIAIRNII